jgi:hypothetical protein
MNDFEKLFKVFIKLFPLLLVAMLGAGHAIVEVTSLINHTTILVFGFKYAPRLWTFFVSLLVTITTLSVAIKVMFNLGKSYKKPH